MARDSARYCAGMSLRLAAYAVCVEDGRVLLVLSVSANGDRTWTLPGGRVEQGEDPIDAVIREVAEETGADAVVERLLGVDSRIVPAADRAPGLPDLHSIGIFYAVRIPEESCGRSRTATRRKRCGHPLQRSLDCVAHRWSRSESVWRRQPRSPDTSDPFLLAV